MKPINNYDDYEASEVVSSGLQKGIYVMKVVKVIDVSEKQYLEVWLDVAKGPQANFFTKAYEANNKWPNQAIHRASYKDSAAKFFKAFITAIEKSNINYRWDWDEQKLVNKLCVAAFGEEEYEKDGEIKVSVKIREIRSTEALAKNEIKMPEYKALDKKVSPVEVNTNISEENLPF